MQPEQQPAAPGERASQQEVDALVALFAQQQFAQAVTRAQALVQRDPRFGFGWLVLGAGLLSLGQLAPAIEAMTRATALGPDDALAHANLCHALVQAGRLEPALAAGRRAVQLAPAMAQARLNLAVGLSAAGQLTEAQTGYQWALQLQPDFVEAWWNLGLNCRGLGQLHEAARCCQRALQLRPQDAAAHSVLAGILGDMGRHDEALAQAQRALQLRPGFAEAWGNLLFALNYHPELSAEAVFSVYQDYGRSVVQAATAAVPVARRHEDASSPRRLRVGYVSPAFKRHSCQHFLEPLLAHHDKNLVEVFAYAELAQEDEVTARYRGYADHWVATMGLSDDALARRVCDDGIDVLVDLAGHTRGHRLAVFARKPAPVSLHWLDFGYTTGLSAIDHYLTDWATVPAGADRLFSERPWRLEGPALVYRPAAGMGDVGPLPALVLGHITFGSLTRAIRINHRTVRVWAQLLHQVPGARLRLDGADFRDAELCQQLVAQFSAHGIAPQRLQLGYHSPPWETLRQIDIMLDCFPHNSGTTLLEGLYMGLPFVTLAGRPSVGRLGAGILQALGRPQWVAADEAQYVQIGAALATDIPALQALRAGLRQQLAQGPLMDEPGFARRVEAAYQAMWRQACMA
jgi:predicted O-linked N-acetylglucosamine transferase (SPINDLY family)